MSAWKYKRLTSKVIVTKQKLIKPKDLVDFAGRNLDSIATMLAKTPYQIDVSEIPGQLSSVSIEKALLKNFIRTCNEMARYSSKDIRSLVSAVLMKFEGGNVKAMLRTKKAGLGIDEAMKYITPVGRLDETMCRQILEKSNSVTDVVNSLTNLGYQWALEEALKAYEGTGILLLLEAAVDKFVYSEIWKTAGKLRGLDKKIAKVILGMEIDSINVKVVLRAKEMGLNPDQAKGYLIPVSEVIGEKELKDAMKAPDVESSIHHFLTAAKLAMARDYEYLLTALAKEYENTKSLSRLEIVLDKGLLKTSLRMLKRYTPFFNIGLVLAFLDLKWFEVRNLRAIVRGAEANVPPEKTRRLLILPD